LIDKKPKCLEDMASDLEFARDALRSECEAHRVTTNHLRHANRLTSLGGLVAGLLHEIGTPLNVILGRSTLIQGDSTVKGCHRNARLLELETRRVIELTRSLLEFAHHDPLISGLVDLNELARRSIILMRILPESRKVDFELRPLETPIWCHGDSTELLQVVLNLLSNALHASSKGGIVLVEVGEIDADASIPPDIPAGRYACVRVIDHGVGISSDILPSIFRSFFTTKPVGEGTGLGLSVSENIVRSHSGWMTVQSSPGEGSCFTAHFPSCGKR
jgi:signal transduction histidine kinase